MTALVVCFSLVLARVASFVAVLPLLGGPSVPRTIKAGLALALTVYWFDASLASVPGLDFLARSAPAPWLSYGLTLGREALLGALLGYALGLFLVPAHIAGEFITQEMGLSFGSQVSLTGSGGAGPVTQIFEMLATAIFFGLDGHHVFLGVLDGTFTQYPLAGAPARLPVQGLVAVAASAQEWGLMLAAPVALCLFLSTVVLALLTRAAPQMNLYTVGFPLRLAAGLVGAILLMPGWVASVVSAFGRFGDLVARLI